MNALLDETSQPSLRRTIGRLLATCTSAEVAVGHIRLSALDLAEHETGSVQRCRMLLGRLEVRALTDFGFLDDAASARVRALLSFVESGRLEIRSAGLGAWYPDFSIFHNLAHARPDTCLIGAHYFREPVTANGPSFTAVLTDTDSISRAVSRFDNLWERSHDVLHPVHDAIRRQSLSAV